ncbi:NAD(P)-binding protein [Cucurbitaria berberidis CBS 394.84]|uniref:NAD(P)-binding protein n=1 Tax=Cucurbitaria berberidis CBS 394.84 TaxID=1168544 RepID=A0A9P4GGF5_9PLEO|nr:NAD(P)-binding protein [Cucurbitaria berberidis CBS 394.84]KAF1844996.1 NAD(P)-binding protein [Cucurbitaria berberidis CBS 394.84]
MSSAKTPLPTKILLLGAGELGTAFLPHLSALPNTHITIGVRSPQNYTHLTTSNITLTPLDLTSSSTHLAELFSHYDILISATGFGQDTTSIPKLATEALEAGKLRKARGESKLWFFPWQWGVDYDVTGDVDGLMPLFGAQKSVRNRLRAEAEDSHVQWTIVSTGIFMSFLFEEFWGIVERKGKGEVTVRSLRDWEHGVTVTDVQDIGRVLARIVAGDVDAENRVLYLAGDSIRYGELADLIGRVTGKEVVREAWSVDHLKEELRKDPENGIKKYRLAFAGEGVVWSSKGTVNYELGIDMLDLGTYVKRLFSELK